MNKMFSAFTIKDWWSLVFDKLLAQTWRMAVRWLINCVTDCHHCNENISHLTAESAFTKDEYAMAEWKHHWWYCRIHKKCSLMLWLLMQRKSLSSAVASSFMREKRSVDNTTTYRITLCPLSRGIKALWVKQSIIDRITTVWWIAHFDR